MDATIVTDALKLIEQNGRGQDDRGLIATREEREIMLTAVMRGEQMGTKPHPKYPEIEIPVIPPLSIRLRALDTLAKIQGDYTDQSSVSFDFANELMRMKQLALQIENNRIDNRGVTVIDAEYSESFL